MSVVVCKVLFWALCCLFSTDVLHGSNRLPLLEAPLAVECLLLGVVAVHCLAVAHCLLPSPLTSLASFVCISSSVALVPAVADWVLVMPCLVLSVLQSVALVLSHSS